MMDGSIVDKFGHEVRPAPLTLLYIMAPFWGCFPIKPSECMHVWYVRHNPKYAHHYLLQKVVDLVSMTKTSCPRPHPYSISRVPMTCAQNK
jgi:hypothetical protein